MSALNPSVFLSPALPTMLHLTFQRNRRQRRHGAPASAYLHLWMTLLLVFICSFGVGVLFAQGAVTSANIPPPVDAVTTAAGHGHHEPAVDIALTSHQVVHSHNADPFGGPGASFNDGADAPEKAPPGDLGATARENSAVEAASALSLMRLRGAHHEDTTAGQSGVSDGLEESAAEDSRQPQMPASETSSETRQSATERKGSGDEEEGADVREGAGGEEAFEGPGGQEAVGSSEEGEGREVALAEVVSPAVRQDGSVRDPVLFKASRGKDGGLLVYKQSVHRRHIVSFLFLHHFRDAVYETRNTGFTKVHVSRCTFLKTEFPLKWNNCSSVCTTEPQGSAKQQKHTTKRCRILPIVALP